MLIWLQLLAQHRSMECLEDPEKAAAEAESGSAAAASAAPEEKAKRTKHTRVQKREKELYGLVTPVFLPLLDARDVSPKQEQKKPSPKPEQQQQQAGGESGAPKVEHATPTGEHGEKSKEGRKSRREHSAVMQDRAASEPSQHTQHGEMSKKPKRASTSSSSTPAPTKKSALRQHSSTKPRRKRVSLVIDGHTVLPADSVTEPALTSPSSEATSASTSTASLDEMLVDPRLAEPHIHTEHAGDAVHHSLPLPMSNNVHSPTKPLVNDHTPTSLTIDPSIRSPLNLPSSYNHPTPLSKPSSLPSPDLEIQSSTPTDEAADAEDAQTFSTYVGGLRGSGADDVDQAGSYGYPSSLGASYLESYMQSRPLRVRMEAADRAGLEGQEREGLLEGKVVEGDGEDEEEEQRERKGKRRDEDDEGDFMGEMEGF